jgi:hypothetical protein
MATVMTTWTTAQCELARLELEMQRGGARALANARRIRRRMDRLALTVDQRLDVLVRLGGIGPGPGKAISATRMQFLRSFVALTWRSRSTSRTKKAV